MPLGALSRVFPARLRDAFTGQANQERTMKKMMLIAALAAGVGLSIAAFAQVPASAPAGTTGLCK
ncbi:hypothetical protein SB861_62800, partial [Paraburkholderia sp. SIMBA_049]